MPARNTTQAFLLVAMIIPISACGGEAPIVPASGTVYRPDGLPLADASIIFRPVDGADAFRKKHKSIPISILGDDGRFEMYLRADVEGVPSGRYKVYVMMDDENAEAKFPSQYFSFLQTPWEITLGPGGKSDIVLRMAN